MKIPKAIEKLIESFEKLPGIGPKTAQRLAFYLLFVPQSDLEQFASHLSNLKKSTVLCSICYNIGDKNPCEVCSDPARDSSTVCVVEDALDVIALEKSGKYNGIYHVLHGVIDPLNNLGPDDIYIPQLISKIKNKILTINEVIIATNPTMEGEATAMYITRELKDPHFAKASRGEQNSEIKITRIGRGLPIGADLEYADEITLQRALEGRREY